MENDGMDESDPGSGWLEVKKKHRSSSKFSVHSASGASSSKTYSANPHPRGGGNPCRGRHPKYPRTGPRSIAHANASNGNTCPAASGVDKGEGCSANVVVSQDYSSSKGTELSGGTTVTSEVQKEEGFVEVSKIKWGDLDDASLILNKCTVYSHGTSKVGCGHGALLDDEAAVNVDALKAGAPHSPSEKERAAATSEDAEPCPDEMISKSVTEESLEENCREVDETPPEDLTLIGSNAEVSFSNDVAASFGKAHDKLTESSQYEGGDDSAVATTSGAPCHSVAPKEEMMPERQGPDDKLQNAVINISKVPIVSNTSHTSSSLQDLIPRSDHDCQPKNDLTVINEVKVSLKEGLEVVDDPGGVGQEESKERFRQRLWCFLFENLNRAVDELYLLCELECDMEQIEEAILVLDEAGSDFRELKSRVEGFESSKRLPSQMTRDGMTVNARTDHRRPHALSWEVRRMTTTSNRAEILSSSIEAFKKIQQERADSYILQDLEILGRADSSQHKSDKLQNDLAGTKDILPNHKTFPERYDVQPSKRVRSTKQRKQIGDLAVVQSNMINGVLSLPVSNSSPVLTKVVSRNLSGMGKDDKLEHVSGAEKQAPDNDKTLNEIKVEKQTKSPETLKKHSVVSEKEKEKQNIAPWKTMDAWKEKRNWEDILRSPMRTSSRVSHSPGVGRKSVDRGRVLHHKLMSPEKKKKTTLDMKREAEDRHARAMRIRNELENERVQRLQRTSEKLNRVNEWQAVRSLKLRERMHARHQRSESRHEAYLAQVARRAGDESSKVNEVRFITSLNEENKKLILRQKLHDSEVRRAEKLQVIRTKQKEDSAREEAVLERKKLLEAEKLQRIAETQRRKEEAKVRREEERKASSAAREARAVEQLRRKEVRAKAQQEEAEILAQKLAERLKESEQRRKFYLEQIRERASMDFRDLSSPLLRRPFTKEAQGRPIPVSGVEEYQATCNLSTGGSSVGLGDGTLHTSLKRRIKKIRQRLMALKYEFSEPSLGAEFAGIGYRSVVGAARAKVGRWLQDLQRLRQARKEGAASIGLIVVDMIKYLEGKEPELHASRKGGLIDFIASALPASHTSRPEACQVTRYLLRLLQVVLSLPTNRSYFLSQNLLPPIIPMLSASLENYIKIAASSNLSGTSTIPSNKTYVENLESIAEVLDGFLCTVTTILGHIHSDERQLQMYNGLVELVVSYQIIHRLRDLFALYDRPQIEGSPFPSSILLSLNLLAVLTSRSGMVSSIDWESYLFNTFSETSRKGDFIGKDSNSLCTGDVASVGENSQNFNSATVSEPVSAAVDHSGGTNRGGQPSQDIISLLNVSDIHMLDVNRQNQVSDISLDMEGIEATSSMGSKLNSDKSACVISEEHSESVVPSKIENHTTDVRDERCKRCEPMISVTDECRKEVVLKQPETFLISAISETGLVSLPSLLTAVLLQANNRLSSEQTAYTLPCNFEEVATGVLKVLNNIALLDISLLQNMLARPDLQMEFFHLMSFLLSHCNSKWKGANDQVGLLLLESLLLLGYFALFHPGNQEVLRWGKNPTILHKVCDLPFVFFSDPELTPILAGTLVAACYGCEQNRDVVQQELSMEMLLTLLRSCRQELQRSRPAPLLLDSQMADAPGRGNHAAEYRRPPGDLPSRSNGRGAQAAPARAVSASNARISRVRNHRDGRLRTCDDWALKHNLPSSGVASSFMLHSRLPSILIDKAEEFFLAGIPKEPA